MFENFSITRKFPAIIVLLGLFAAFATGLVAILHATNGMQAATEGKLLTLLETRRNALADHFASISDDLRFQAENAWVQSALVDFEMGWEAIGGGAREQVKSLYVTNNPHPAGDREDLDNAGDGSPYSFVHAQYHPGFKVFLRARGYDDLFLVDPEGNLVYSVTKEPDFATNLLTGPWRDTDLAEAFRAVSDNRAAGYQVFFDFKPYGPRSDQPASFIATPVFDVVDNFVGVLAFQMPVARINDVMQVTTSMGETGETYIVGSDFLMRSDSRFSEDSTILKTWAETESVRAALAGQTGAALTLDYRGASVLSAYGLLDFLGTRWVVIADIEEAEALAPVNDMRTSMLAGGGRSA